MRFLYDAASILIILAYLPRFLFGKKSHPGLSARFGKYPAAGSFRNPVWIHAVSVGEMAAMRGLSALIASEFPDKQQLLTTVTPTGNKIARTIARKSDIATYLPLDISFIVKKIVGRVKPCLCIIAETEFWPNLITALSNADIPIIIVNGRISDRSIGGYTRFRRFFAPILGKISLFCVQTEADAERFISLGAAPGSVKVTGNMKFDSCPRMPGADPARLKRSLGIDLSSKVLVAGSTHPGEERYLMDAYEKVLKAFKGTRLVIVPRHPERGREVAELVERRGFKAVRLSCGSGGIPPKDSVLILDVIGRLLEFYSIADAVFVGKSLAGKGGQNFLEPAALGKPVIVGPSLFNFRDMARQFSDKKAFLVVRDPSELADGFLRILSSSGLSAGMVSRARELIDLNRGATRRNLAFIKEYMLKGKT